MNLKFVNVEVIKHKKTGMLLAMSDEMKGLYVHARTEQELQDRIPIAIKALLEAEGHHVVKVEKQKSTVPDDFDLTSGCQKFSLELAA